MTEVEQIEAAVGSKVEQWNAANFTETISLKENEFLLSYFQIPAVVKELSERSKDNPEIFSIFEPLYYRTLQQTALQKIDNILINYSDKDFNINSDPKLLESLVEFQKSAENHYEKIYLYAAIATLFPDYDLSQYYDDIYVSVNETKNSVQALIEYLANYYDLIKDIITVIETLRTQYFAKYNIDIVTDDQQYQEIIDTIASVEASLLNFANEESLKTENFDKSEEKVEEKSEEDKKDDSEDK